MTDILTPAQRSALMAKVRSNGNASTELRLAVFVDGCFWHGCPLHATQPKQNAKFWSDKIAANQTRDRLVTRTLRARGWRVLRVWDRARQREDGRAFQGAAPKAAVAAKGVSIAGRPLGGAAHNTNLPNAMKPASSPACAAPGCSTFRLVKPYIWKHA